MKTNANKKEIQEWKEILKKHPAFGRAFLAQQTILIEASEMGNRIIDSRMCDLLKAGLPVLFSEYWKKKCFIRPGLLQCLMDNKQTPERCYPHGDEFWFEDPITLTPPVIPPLKDKKPK